MNITVDILYDKTTYSVDENLVVLSVIWDKINFTTMMSIKVC